MIAQFCKPYLREAAIMLCLLVAASVLAALPPFFAKGLIDEAIPRHDMRAVWIDVAAMIAAAAAAAFAGVRHVRLNAYVAQAIVRDVSAAVVGHLYEAPLAFYVRTRTGEIMNRALGDADALRYVFSESLSPIVACSVGVVVTVVAIALLDLRLTLVALVLTPVLLLPVAPLSRRVAQAQQRIQESYDQIGAMTQETLSISGIQLVKSFVREDAEARRFHDVSTGLGRLRVEQVVATQWYYGLVGVSGVLFSAVIWLVGGRLVIEGALQVGTVVAFTVYLAQLYGFASALTSVHLHVVAARTVMRRIADYLDMETENAAAAGAVVLERPRGALAFDDVRFTYPAGDRGLDGVSFSIEPGQTAAFVGASGAGKSTIAQLTARLYEPQHGSIRIDGRDVREVALRSLREHVGIVTQETYLFHDTIAANLRYAAPSCSDEAMRAAAREANIHDTIAALPHGYDTVVGERGHALSGGERQRVAIARMFLKQPQILILDEATSALDAPNEIAVHDAAMRLVRGRTCLVLAHRLSTIAHADVIFVLVAGRVVERGTHAQLVAAGGAYAQLFSTDLFTTAT